MQLMVEFDLLGNLDEEDLLGIRNDDIPGLNFKSRKGLVQQALELAQHDGDGELPTLTKP